MRKLLALALMFSCMTVGYLYPYKALQFGLLAVFILVWAIHSRFQRLLEMLDTLIPHNPTEEEAEETIADDEVEIEHHVPMLIQKKWGDHQFAKWMRENSIKEHKQLHGQHTTVYFNSEGEVAAKVTYTGAGHSTPNYFILEETR